MVDTWHMPAQVVNYTSERFTAVVGIAFAATRIIGARVGAKFATLPIIIFDTHSPSVTTAVASVPTTDTRPGFRARTDVKRVVVVLARVASACVRTRVARRFEFVADVVVSTTHTSELVALSGELLGKALVARVDSAVAGVSQAGVCADCEKIKRKK